MGAGKDFKRVMSEFGLGEEEADVVEDSANALQPLDKDAEELERRLAASREQRKMRSSSDPVDPDHSSKSSKSKSKASLRGSKPPATGAPTATAAAAAAAADTPAAAVPAAAATAVTPAAAAAAAAAAGSKGKLMTVELKESGSVSTKAYFLLAVYGGFAVSILVLLFQMVCTTSNSLGAWWLTEWTAFETSPPTAPDRSRVLPGDASTTQHYLLIYAATGVMEAIATVAFAVCFVFMMINVSRKIHAALVRRLSRAPMSFFDTTPIGRILNRLSADLDLIDTRLPMSLQQYIVQFLNAIGILCIIALVNAIMVGPLIGLAILYYIVQHYYRYTSIELQRLESVSRSPMYAHFGQTLQGLSSVRSYGTLLVSF